MSGRKKVDPEQTNVLVIFDPENKEQYNEVTELTTGYLYLYLGEIKNMKGHCAVVNNDSQISYGWHIDCFRMPEDWEI